MKNYLTQNLAKYYLPEGINNFNSSLIQKSELTVKLNTIRISCLLINNYFRAINALASQPVVTMNTNTVIIHVFYFIPNGKARLNRNTINNLGEVLTRLFKRPVQLRLTRLHYPYLEAYILAQYIGLNRRDYKLTHIIRRLFGSAFVVKNTQTPKALNTYLPSHIVGVKVRVSGRLVTERSRPRFTVQTAEVGTFSKHNLSLVDLASYSTKNKKNALTVKVWINQQANV